MIRAARQQDAGQVLSIYAPIVRQTHISFETEVPSEEEMTHRIDHSHLWLVYEEAGRVLGYSYAALFHPRAAYRWSVEVSIYLAAAARGRGVGRDLLGSLLSELTEAGFVNAFAGVALPNLSSVRLFESFGFEQIALQKAVGYKLGAWRDVGWWQLQLRAPSVPPPELRLDGPHHHRR